MGAVALEIITTCMAGYQSMQLSTKSQKTKELTSGTSNDLGKREGGAHMQPGQSLKQNHSQPDTLDGIKHSEPKPETSAKVRSYRPSPRDIH